MSQYFNLLGHVAAELTTNLAGYTVDVRRKPRLVSTDTGNFCIVSPVVESVEEESFGYNQDGAFGAVDTEPRRLQISYPVLVTLFVDSQHFLTEGAEDFLDARETVRKTLYKTDFDTFDATDVSWDPDPAFDTTGLNLDYDASSQLFTYVLEDTAETR